MIGAAGAELPVDGGRARAAAAVGVCACSLQGWPAPGGRCGPCACGSWGQRRSWWAPTSSATSTTACLSTRPAQVRTGSPLGLPRRDPDRALRRSGRDCRERRPALSAPPRAALGRVTPSALGPGCGAVVRGGGRLRAVTWFEERRVSV